MAKQRHYSPQLSRFIVSVLYHQAKAAGIPMTKLTDELLRKALANTDAWKRAESLRIEASPSIPTPHIQAA